MSGVGKTCDKQCGTLLYCAIGYQYRSLTERLLLHPHARSSRPPHTWTLAIRDAIAHPLQTSLSTRHHPTRHQVLDVGQITKLRTGYGTLVWLSKP